MAAAPVGRVFQFKLVLLGDSAVGKSSLVLRFVRGQFFEYQESTIGAAFLTQTVALNDTTVKFEIWDTAGQERYHSLAPMYYRGAAAAIVVYDITNRDTFQRAKQWVKELQRQGNPNIVIALAGNKSDLNSKRKVEPEEAESCAAQLGAALAQLGATTAQFGAQFSHAGICPSAGTPTTTASSSWRRPPRRRRTSTSSSSRSRANCQRTRRSSGRGSREL